MKQNKLTFESENLVVDYISFNLEGFMDPEIVAHRLLKYFTPHVLIDDVPSISFHGLKKKSKVSVRHYTGSKSYWVGTQIIFSGKNASYFYNLIKTQNFDWSIFKFEQHSLRLGRIDLCFSRNNGPNDTIKSFDAFLVDSRTQIQNHTNTKHIRLQDFPDGKILKINRRNNSLHYRVYQKDQNVRFEIELKHRQTKLVQDYLFQNQLDVFENQLVIKYFQYSKRVLYLDYTYTDWILDFERRHREYDLINSTYSLLVTSYLENQRITNQEEEKRLFHLLQFLSFIKSLELNPGKNYKKHTIKKQDYYYLKFPLSKFVNFTGIKISSHYGREKLLFYFYQLQTLDPILKIFSSRAFRSYICFPYIECENPSGKLWVIEILVAEELFYFPYPFQLSKSFLYSSNKNDLRLKVRIVKSLAVSKPEKTLDLEEFFILINLRNNQLIKIKKNIIQLLNELA